MTEIEPIATRIPYMVGVGNHEYGNFLENFPRIFFIIIFNIRLSWSIF